jgi:hypothetical protein
MKLLDTKSKFVKNKIRMTRWKDLEYIEDLLFLEKAILGKTPKSWLSGYKLYGLMDRYKTEYRKIKDELNPGWREKERKEALDVEQKELREEEKWKAECLREAVIKKKEWLKLGGKL